MQENENVAKKKIGIISGLFGTKYVGGAEIQLYYLSRQFAKWDMKFTL